MSAHDRCGRTSPLWLRSLCGSVHVRQERRLRRTQCGVSHAPAGCSPYTFVAADALVLNVRENGRVTGVHIVIATGINAQGYWEIPGVQVSSAEDGAG